MVALERVIDGSSISALAARTRRCVRAVFYVSRDV